MKELSKFGLACHLGQLQEVVKVFFRFPRFAQQPNTAQFIMSGTAPPLTGAETTFEFGYATLTIAGAQWVSVLPGHTTKLQHEGTLCLLLAKGTPPDVLDILGYTTPHHACMYPNEKLQLARILLQNGANVDYQDRFASSAIIAAMQHKDLDTINGPIEFRADVDLPDVNNCTLRSTIVVFKVCFLVTF